LLVISDIEDGREDCFNYDEGEDHDDCKFKGGEFEYFDAGNDQT